MSHVAFISDGWDVSRTPFEWVMSHVHYMRESCHTYEWVMSHIWMSHVTHMNESCHTYEWVLSHIWMSHVTHMNESCHTYEWVMSHIWMSHVTHESIGSWLLAADQTSYKWVMSHIYQMDESCLTYSIWMSRVTRTLYVWVMSHMRTYSRGSRQPIRPHINESCRTYIKWMSHVSHIPFEQVASHVHHMDESRHTAAPMNHVKYLRASPAEMPFQNWYTANTNHFHLTDSVRWTSTRQLYWVINPVPHNLVRRIRFWRIKSLEQDFKHCAER